MIFFPFGFAVPFARPWDDNQSRKERLSCVTSAISSMRFTASPKLNDSVIGGRRVWENNCEYIQREIVPVS
jgi:hypothetical protein